MDMIATMRRPNELGTPANPDEEVRVVGYLWGWHADDRGVSSECALAVVIGADGKFREVPLSWLRR